MMQNKANSADKPRSKSIRSRLILCFAALSVVLSIIFGAYNILFMWVVEDSAFTQILRQEKERILAHYQEFGGFIQPLNKSVRLIEGAANLPEEMRLAIKGNRSQAEFFGENGANYHLLKIRELPNVYLLGDFSQQKLVSPVLKIILSILASTMVFLTALACLIGYYFANIAFKPLSDLILLLKQSTPEKLPEKFSNQFDSNEIGFLAQTLEDMLGRIRGFIDREQHFTRDVSHELRTPIAVIKGVGEIMQTKHMADLNPQLTRLQNATFDMENIVTTLLALAHESQALEQKEDMAILPMVEEVVIQYSDLLEDKPIAFERDIPQDAKVHAHPIALRMLLANLISNAFKYTQEGVVSVRFRPGCLVVSDSGMGIGEQVKDKVFESGVKGKHSNGFGIGLSLVRRLCEKQGIEISIDSNQTGTTVTLNF